MKIEIVKIEEWLKLKRTLDAAKSNESEARKEICNAILGDKISGVSHAESHGPEGIFDVAATGKINHSIDKPALKTIWPELTTEEKKAVQFTPKILVSAYKKLPADSKLKSVVTVKPGLPSLAVKLK